MAVAPKKNAAKQQVYSWEGTDKSGKKVKGEISAGGEAQVNAMLRRQGVKVTKVRKQRMAMGGKITEKDIALFTRQLATMMQSGVPLLQAFGRARRGAQSADGVEPPRRPVQRSRGAAGREQRDDLLLKRLRWRIAKPSFFVSTRRCWSPCSAGPTTIYGA